MENDYLDAKDKYDISERKYQKGKDTPDKFDLESERRIAYNDFYTKRAKYDKYLLKLATSKTKDTDKDGINLIICYDDV